MKNLSLVLVGLLSLVLIGCNWEYQEPVSNSGIKKAEVKIAVGSDGFSAEQRNVIKRYKKDNELGSIKHLYIISAMSGQVIIYSTVDGKVTSSGKRLTPTSTTSGDLYGMDFAMGNHRYETNEVIQDDGTYGSSVEYLYWFDVKGVYHQHYVSGGQIVHISDQALPVKEIVINLSE